MSSRYLCVIRGARTGFALVAAVSMGCTNANYAQRGALFGTAVGSLAGAAIGSDSGHAGAGALIGGLTGAMAGTVIGDAEDARVERDIAYAERNSAIAQAQYLQAQQQALTNLDLIRLSQTGVGDDVIINMIRTRGGRFDLGTEAVIALKSQGVSDRVIVAAQSAPQAATLHNTSIAAPAPGVVYVPGPPAVIVEPAPPVFYGGYWGPYHRPRHRSGVDFFFGF